MKNTYQQKTTPVSQFLVQEQITEKLLLSPKRSYFGGLSLSIFFSFGVIGSSAIAADDSHINNLANFNAHASASMSSSLSVLGRRDSQATNNSRKFLVAEAQNNIPDATEIQVEQSFDSGSTRPIVVSKQQQDSFNNTSLRKTSETHSNVESGDANNTSRSSVISKLRSDIAQGPQASIVIPVESASSQEKVIKNQEPHNPSLVGTAPSDASMDYPENSPINVEGPDGSPMIPLGNLPNFTGYQWPTRGMITSGYGRRWGRMHKGIDIASSIGTPVVAAAPGEVVSAGWNSGGYGNLVVIRHADGSETLYGHNNRVLVRVGQIVHQGEEISEMGSTGHSTGPHLHFEVHPNGGAAVNPIAFLPSSR